MANTERLKKAALSLAAPVALVAPVVSPATPAQAQASSAELRILSPRSGDTLTANSFALDVSFRSRSKSPIVTAELWVDGTRWIRRNLDTPQFKNVLSFDVDASTLAEGAHTFIVRVFNADGSSAEKQVALQVAARAEALEEEVSSGGPEMKFIAPLNNKRVSGVVELLLDAPARNGVNPYVTFYIDKQFKTLKNYPPYSYTWDTTTTTNGYHTVEAMGYLEASNASTARRLRVYVDNPGGNTTVQSAVPDLRKAQELVPTTAVSSIIKPVTIPITRTAEPRRLEAGARSAAALVASGLKTLPADLTPDVAAEVNALSARVAKAATVPAIKPAARLAKKTTANRAVKTGANRINNVTGTTVRTGTPQVITPSAADVVASRIAQTLADDELLPLPTPPVRSTKSGVARRTIKTLGATVAAPKPVLSSTSRPVAVSPLINAPIKVSIAKPTQEVMVPLNLPTKTTRATPKAMLRPVSSTLHQMMETRGLQVAFDGTRIAFDVQPRVEKGLPIAPFRQIFEHTGGQVMWVRQTRMVRAINADREIIIAVGKKKARVNGETLTMERAASVERGRTIVPLSFVRDALDVNVKYDAATGRIQITSKE